MPNENKNPVRWLILLLVVVAAGGAFLLRGGKDQAAEVNVVATDTVLPRLLDLGADKCVPCKMMVPVLDELEKGLDGQLEVVFLDVWQNPDQAKPYKIKLIPTQIFFAPDGEELFRHEGFFARDDILAKWQELGYELDLPVAARPEDKG